MLQNLRVSLAYCSAGSAQLSASTHSVQQLVCRYNAQSKPAAIASFPEAANLGELASVPLLPTVVDLLSCGSSEAVSALLRTLLHSSCRLLQSRVWVCCAESQLNLLGVTTAHLSETGRQHLQIIAGVADKLGLASAEPAAVLAAMARFRQQHWSAEDSQAAATALSSQLREQIADVRQLAEELSAVSRTLEQQREAAQAGLEGKEERMLRMHQKAAQYAAELEQLDRQLKRDGFVPEVL